MDGSFPLLRDPNQASPPPDVDKWKRAIAEARAGSKSDIGTKAAAYYLDVHYTTLREWVRAGVGPEPIKNPVKAGSAALNQHMKFTLDALDAFKRTREGDVITRGNRTEAEELRREAERIQARIELKAAQDALAKARERAKRVGVLSFGTLSEASEVHPWARIDGRIRGHLWAVDDEVFASLDLDDVFEGTLEQALLEPWVDNQFRFPFDNAMVAVLDQASQVLSEARHRQREADATTLQHRLDGNTADAPGSAQNDGGDRL